MKLSTLKPPYYPPTTTHKSKSSIDHWISNQNNDSANLVQRHQNLVERVKNDKMASQANSKNWTGEKNIIESSKSLISPQRKSQSKANLANPQIFSEEKPPMKARKQNEVYKHERKGKASKKPKDRGNNKLSIIHLKRKHTRTSSIDGRSASKNGKKKQVLPSKPATSTSKTNNTKHSTEHLSKSKSLKATKEVDAKPKHSKEIPKPLEIIFNKRECVIKENQKLPTTDNGFDSINSISVIKDASAYKITEFDINSHERKYLKSRLPNLDDSDFGDESDLSQYLMINPLNEKTNTYGFATGELVGSQVNVHTGHKGEEWTMDVPKIKYTSE